MKRLLFLSPLCLAACAGLGSMPGVVVEMYDKVSPDGMIEIEAERSGKIIEIEAEIAVDDVPANVREAAAAQLPGGRVTGAEYEVVGRKRSYEVKMAKGGRDYEFVFDLDGNLLESEKELMRNEAPKAVADAGIAAVPGANFKSVEILTAGGEDVYHVKTTKGGATYKIVLSEDGTVLRKVREQRTELEIPIE